MRAPAYQRYPAEELARRHGMSLAARGAVDVLNDYAWSQSEDQCSLPDDDKMLARIAGATVEEWMVLREEILCEGRNLFVQRNGRLISLRLKDEAAKQRKYRKSQSEKGRLSAQQRLSRGSTSAQPMHQPEANSSTLIPIPIPNEEKKEEEKSVASGEAPTAKRKSGKSQKLAALEAFIVSDEIREWARKEFGVEILDDVVDEFKAHWRAQSKLRDDWTATFKNRIRQVVGWKQLQPAKTNGLALVPPQKKCEWTTKTGPCQDYAITGSRFCAVHKTELVTIQQKKGLIPPGNQAGMSALTEANGFTSAGSVLATIGGQP